MNDADEYNTMERIAKLSWYLALGKVFTTREASVFIGASYSWTLRLLKQLCRIVPIRFEDEVPFGTGYWYSIQHYKGINKTDI